MDLKSWPCWAKVAGAIGLMVFVFNWPKSSGEWASWVQAIGSIGAIVGAIYIGREGIINSQRIFKEEKKIKREDEMEANKQNIYSVMLMMWRVNSLFIGHFDYLRDIKKIGDLKYIKGQNLKERYFYGLEGDPVNYINQQDRDFCYELLLRLVGSDGNAGLLKILKNSFEGINLLTFPYSAIAEQIIVFVNSFEDIERQLSILKEKKTDAGIVELYRLLFSFMNVTYSSSFYIAEYYGKYSADVNR